MSTLNNKQNILGVLEEISSKHDTMRINKFKIKLKTSNEIHTVENDKGIIIEVPFLCDFGVESLLKNFLERLKWERPIFFSSSLNTTINLNVQVKELKIYDLEQVLLNYRRIIMDLRGWLHPKILVDKILELTNDKIIVLTNNYGISTSNDIQCIIIPYNDVENKIKIVVNLTTKLIESGAEVFLIGDDTNWIFECIHSIACKVNKYLSFRIFSLKQVLKKIDMNACILGRTEDGVSGRVMIFDSLDTFTNVVNCATLPRLDLILILEEPIYCYVNLSQKSFIMNEEETLSNICKMITCELVSSTFVCNKLANELSPYVRNDFNRIIALSNKSKIFQKYLEKVDNIIGIVNEIGEVENKLKKSLQVLRDIDEYQVKLYFISALNNLTKEFKMNIHGRYPIELIDDFFAIKRRIIRCAEMLLDFVSYLKHGELPPREILIRLIREVASQLPLTDNFAEDYFIQHFDTRVDRNIIPVIVTVKRRKYFEQNKNVKYITNAVNSLIRNLWSLLALLHDLYNNIPSQNFHLITEIIKHYNVYQKAYYVSKHIEGTSIDNLHAIKILFKLLNIERITVKPKVEVSV